MYYIPGVDDLCADTMTVTRAELILLLDSTAATSDVRHFLVPIRRELPRWLRIEEFYVPPREPESMLERLKRRGREVVAPKPRSAAARAFRPIRQPPGRFAFYQGAF